MTEAAPFDVHVLGSHRCLLGESPLWHPDEQTLYCVDIPGRQVLRWASGAQEPQTWDLPAEPGCIAARAQGGLLIAGRDGLSTLDPTTGALAPLEAPPFDPTGQRFNDGKPDALGRLWVGALSDARAAEASLYRVQDGVSQSVLGGIAVSNGLAWSPDQRTLYRSDTKAHAIFRHAFDLDAGEIGPAQAFAHFPLRDAALPLSAYGGRPDGAAVDQEGCYWVAMFEGQRLLRLHPDGHILQEVMLPVRCPTMPCFGGPDLRTLFITTARDKRPADELAAQPEAGGVLWMRVEVPGLAAHRVNF